MARRLVVSRPYRSSRNPDYLLNSVWALLALLPALLVLRYAVIGRVERYRRRVRRAGRSDPSRLLSTGLRAPSGSAAPRVHAAPTTTDRHGRARVVYEVTTRTYVRLRR
jgi:hypothetical protein